MIPYLASLKWCGGFRQGDCPEPPRRRWNRALIAPDELLSIPVKGGISTIKHSDPALWLADDSRSWRHQHIGAINARLGRTPFFHHYASEIIEYIADTSITGVKDLAVKILNNLIEPLDTETFLNEYREASTFRKLRISAYRDSLISKAPDSDLSLLTHLCHLGPDTIFLLALPL